MEKGNVVREEVYEELKMLAAMRENVPLQFRADNGGIVTIQTKIREVFEEDEHQYLVGENGLTLQLHQLVSINGKPLDQFC